MSDTKLCRICVRTDVKMYEHDRFLLKSYYKEVTGCKISKRDCLPKWFCFECAALLHKFNEFKIKCYNGQKIFEKLLETGCENLNNIISRTKPINIQPHLQILSASSNNNVKTYIVKHSEISKSKKNKIHSRKKKLNNFTEVFVEDVKFEIDNSKISVQKILQKSTDIENLSETNDKFSINDGGSDNNDINYEDSNDSIPINNGNDVGNGYNDVVNNAKEKTDDVERINDATERTSCIEESTGCYVGKTSNDIERTTHDTERTSHDIERTSHNIQRTSHDLERTSHDIERTSHDLERTSTVIESSINLNKPNLDNKFQRSVKKKFLDENHWNKITLSDEEATRRFQSKALEQKYLRADFKCTDCYRTFSQEDMMKRHIKLRHCESLGPNECRHCHMRFKWKSRLQKHLKEHYTIYKCLRCELSFPVEISAFQHDYSHNGVTWTCAHCGQGFRHSSTYYTHLRKHKSKYVCSLCGVSFVSEFGLFMHKRVKHVINHDCKEDSSNTYCKVCDIQFDTLKGYEEHFAESALHATEVVEGGSCLPLKTRCTKKRVPRISTNCTICGKTFSTYAAFTKHHLSVHPGHALPKSKTDKQDGQRQICEVCGVTLASTWSLVNHLNTHSRDKRYTCKTCGMQLSSRSVLQRHQLTHTHEKNFVCDLCDKRFSHRPGLRLHLRTHKKDPSPTRSRKKKPEQQNVMEYFKNYGNIATNFR